MLLMMIFFSPRAAADYADADAMPRFRDAAFFLFSARFRFRRAMFRARFIALSAPLRYAAAAPLPLMLDATDGMRALIFLP